MQQRHSMRVRFNRIRNKIKVTTNYLNICIVLYLENILHLIAMHVVDSSADLHFRFFLKIMKTKFE